MAINLSYDMTMWLKLNQNYRPSQIYAWQNGATAVLFKCSCAQHTALTDLQKQTYLCQRPQLSDKPSPELIDTETTELSA